MDVSLPLRENGTPCGFVAEMLASHCSVSVGTLSIRQQHRSTSRSKLSPSCSSCYCSSAASSSSACCCCCLWPGWFVVSFAFAHSAALKMLTLSLCPKCRTQPSRFTHGCPVTIGIAIGVDVDDLVPRIPATQLRLDLDFSPLLDWHSSCVLIPLVPGLSLILQHPLARRGQVSALCAAVHVKHLKRVDWLGPIMGATSICNGLFSSCVPK